MSNIKSDDNFSVFKQCTIYVLKISIDLKGNVKLHEFLANIHIKKQDLEGLR